MGNLRESLPVVRQQSNGLCVRTSINRSLYNNDWRTLGRRLTFKEAQLKEFDNGHEKISDIAYATLSAWKQRDGSELLPTAF